MYVPSHYRESDQGKIDRIIRDHSFATLISRDGGSLVATHLPLELEIGRGGERCLTGHVARANRQWRTFDSGEDVLAIFAGPHSYISPRWYGEVEDVPTWDYVAVHAYGKPRLITEPDELRAMLKNIVDKYEAGAENAYRVEDMPGDFLSKQMKAIVGFRIKVERVEASFKLSQNRSPRDYENVIAELEESGEAGAAGVAQAMREAQPRAGRVSE